MNDMENFYKFLNIFPNEDAAPIKQTDLPDFAYQDSKHFSKEAFSFLEKVAAGSVVGEKYGKLVKDVMNKKYGADVRASLALAIAIDGASLMEMSRELIQNIEEQKQLELEFEDIQRSFTNVIKNVTVDSEVITARNGKYFGEFPTLKEHLDQIELKIYEIIPNESITITHGWRDYPEVSVLWYRHTFAHEKLDSEETLGSKDTHEVRCSTRYPNDRQVEVFLPRPFTLKGKLEQRKQKNLWYIFSEDVTLIFILKNRNILDEV